MEGDVLMGSLPTLLGVAASVLGGVFALLKWFAGRLIADIEQRLSRIDGLEDRFERLMAELPLHYQRRDDHVREMREIDERYGRMVENLITSQREEIAALRNRIVEIEKAREQDVLLYQRRDDAIREYTAMNAKLDRIYEIMMEIKNVR